MAMGFAFRRWRPPALAGLLLAALLTAPPGGARGVLAEDTDWKAGRLGHLAGAIGTYGYDRVLGDPAVAAALAALTGGADARTIAANMAVAAPIEFMDASLVLRGNAPHRGGEEEALVMVRLFDGTVRAALLHGGRMKLYASDERFDYLPKVLRDFLAPRADRPPPPARLPPGVEWVGRGRP
ncbi:MAG: hypothetical protein H6907_07225 [Hyphomicrobiales bacterium]|nr:hypothetical protein [Hyphomicrobiales bacterium]